MYNNQVNNQRFDLYQGLYNIPVYQQQVQQPMQFPQQPQIHINLQPPQQLYPQYFPAQYPQNNPFVQQAPLEIEAKVITKQEIDQAILIAKNQQEEEQNNINNICDIIKLAALITVIVALKIAPLASMALPQLALLLIAPPVLAIAADALIHYIWEPKVDFNKLEENKSSFQDYIHESDDCIDLVRNGNLPLVAEAFGKKILLEEKEDQIRKDFNNAFVEAQNAYTNKIKEINENQGTELANIRQNYNEAEQMIRNAAINSRI